MFKMVDGTGIIGVDMICPLGISTPQPPNYDRVELEGTGMLVLPNSLDAPLERLEFGGKMAGKKEVIQAGELEQGTITAHAGTNYDSNYRVRTKNYINLTSGTYEVTCTGVKLGNAVFYSVENKFEKMLSETHIPLPIKFTLTENKLVRVLFSNSESIPIAPTDIKNAILEADVSPEHPQDIVNSGKWNDGTRKYEIEISISGRNLFDFSTCEEGKVFEGSGNIVSATNGVLTDFIPCFPNSQYSRTRTGSTVVAFYDRDKNKIGLEIVGNTTFVTPEKCRYFRFSAVKTLLDYTKIVACPGQTVMDYEPYREPKFFTLTSDRPLTKWDRLVEQGGEIGWLYNTDKYIVTGQESFETKPSYVMEETVDFAFMNNKQSGIRKAADNFCNRLTYVDSVWSKHDVGFGISGVEVHIRLPLEAIGASSSDESAVIKTKFSEYLKKKYDGGGPFVFYHKSKTTEFIPLPQSEQNAIRALKTYYPTTVITADGGELDPDIKVTYRKEI